MPFLIYKNMNIKALTLYIFSLLSVLITVSCSEDVQFSTDRNITLSFSKDTVSFDTLFNEIGSATKRLIVYNHSDKGVILSNVSLLSGGESGFRMNVDGQYGTTVKDVEVLGNDSIFVFVEVTPKESETEEFTPHSDNIVFTLENGQTQSVFLEACGQKANTLRHKVFEGNDTLSSPLSFIVYDSLVVAEGATLTITEGTKLYFHSDANLIVRGQLNVEGSLNNEVVFRGDRTDKIFTNLPYDRLASQWRGIYLAPSCTGCNIQYADIHSGYFGVICDSINGQLTITNSSIHNTDYDALEIRYSNALIANTQISNAFTECVALIHANVNFYHCTIAQFYPWSADRGTALYIAKYPWIQNEWASTETKFYNCLITGYEKDDILILSSPEMPTLDAYFYSCVLNTDITDDQYLKYYDCFAESKDNATFQESNFYRINTEDYCYDFRLDSLSVAIGKGSAEYSKLYPTDKNGIVRGDKPDVGCYQYVNPKQ